MAGFAEKAVPLLVEKGMDDLLSTIKNHMESRPSVQEALSDSVRNMMASVKILTGKKGPDLMFYAPVRTQTKTSAEDIIIETEKLEAVYT
ncbi:MAG: hypothetical protein ABR534_16635, partial [Desulfotignum sp.]